MNPDLRLLMVSPNAVPGGAEDVFFNLAVTLPDHGVTPRLVSLQTGPLIERLTQQGIAVQIIEAGRLREPHKFVLTSRRVAAVMRSGRFDAVFSNLPKAHLYVAFGASRHRLPALWCQADFPDPPHWMDRVVCALPAAGVIAVSRDAAAAQRRLNGRHHVHTMHPGIDLTRFRVASDPEIRSRHGISADIPLVSLVGRLQPWKGQREFLRAAAILARSHPSAHFAVIGGAILGWEGDYPDELERLASTLGISERVTFTGHSDEVSRWMSASDIVVNASQPEPFGLVVVEAMASGCPVVAVATGGPRDIIEDGLSGLLCESREPAMLAKAVGRLLDDADLRGRLGTAGRERAERLFSREAMAERFSEIVRQAARSAG